MSRNKIMLFAIAMLSACAVNVLAQQTELNTIRPFHVNFPQAALDDIRQRVGATRWPGKETVTDATQGAARDHAEARALLAD